MRHHPAHLPTEAGVFITGWWNDGVKNMPAAGGVMAALSEDGGARVGAEDVSRHPDSHEPKASRLGAADV